MNGQRQYGAASVREFPQGHIKKGCSIGLEQPFSFGTPKKHNLFVGRMLKMLITPCVTPLFESFVCLNLVVFRDALEC